VSANFDGLAHGRLIPQLTLDWKRGKYKNPAPDNLLFLVPVPNLALCALWFVPAVLAGKNFVKPVAKTAINYPAHDFHRDEKVAIAADPYDTPEKAKIFSVNFADHGYLPIFFIVTNDGDQPVSIANMGITLITANHSKLTPMS